MFFALWIIQFRKTLPKSQIEIETLTSAQPGMTSTTLRTQPLNSLQFILRNTKFPSLRIGTQLRAPNLSSTWSSLYLKQCT